jgi:hypothetical protein
MRFVLLVMVLVAACEAPLERPRQPNDPNAVNGCTSAPITLGGTRYTCTSYVTLDQVTEPSSIGAFAYRLAYVARGKGYSAKEIMFTMPGVEDTLLVEYADGRGAQAFDVLAMQPLGDSVRTIQCHMAWFHNPRTRARREDTCKQMITALLARPAPPLRVSSPACKEAAAHVATLPGRPEAPEDLERALFDFQAGCTPGIAACGLAAKTFVEATLCREN